MILSFQGVQSPSLLAFPVLHGNGDAGATNGFTAFYRFFIPTMIPSRVWVLTRKGRSTRWVSLNTMSHHVPMLGSQTTSSVATLLSSRSHQSVLSRSISSQHNSNGDANDRWCRPNCDGRSPNNRNDDDKFFSDKLAKAVVERIRNERTVVSYYLFQRGGVVESHLKRSMMPLAEYTTTCQSAENNGSMSVLFMLHRSRVGAAIHLSAPTIPFSLLPPSHEQSFLSTLRLPILARNIRNHPRQIRSFSSLKNDKDTKDSEASPAAGDSHNPHPSDKPKAGAGSSGMPQIQEFMDTTVESVRPIVESAEVNLKKAVDIIRLQDLGTLYGIVLLVFLVITTPFVARYVVRFLEVIIFWRLDAVQ